MTTAQIPTGANGVKNAQIKSKERIPAPIRFIGPILSARLPAEVVNAIPAIPISEKRPMVDVGYEYGGTERRKVRVVQ
jgi:hypothetical protein